MTPESWLARGANIRNRRRKAQLAALREQLARETVPESVVFDHPRIRCSTDGCENGCRTGLCRECLQDQIRRMT